MKLVFHKRGGPVVMSPDSEGLGAVVLSPDSEGIGAVNAGVVSNLSQTSGISYLYIYTFSEVLASDVMFC